MSTTSGSTTSASSARVNKTVLMFAAISVTTSTVVTMCSSLVFRFKIPITYTKDIKDLDGNITGHETVHVSEKFHHGFIMCIIYCMAQTVLVGV